MKIGILKTDKVGEVLVGQFGEYPDMFERLFRQVAPELELRTYRVMEGEYPVQLEEVDAYVMTGSKASVYDQEDWILRLGEFVRILHEREKKFAGICFGHQLVAHVLGGRTEKAASGWNIGMDSYVLNESGKEWLGAGETEIKMLVSHQDQVVVPAPGSEVLASSERCPIGICRLGDHFLTLQGHPEFEPEYARKLFDARRHHFEKDLYEGAMASLDAPRDHLKVAKIILDFLRK